jgi:DNA-binding response OmpR family regulator
MRVLLIQQPSSHLKQALEAQGCVVDPVASRNEANRLARSGSHNLVVFDLGILRKPDLLLIREWRKSGMDAHLLILTSSRSPNDRTVVFDAGADAIVTNPYEAQELAAQIRAMLRRAYPIKGRVLQIFDLTIDTDARLVKRKGKIIQLTRREYELLRFLASHRGKVVSRSQIWSELYDDNGPPTSNVIDVTIRFLRTKIDEGFELPLILTQWGRGYMLRWDSESP